MDPLKNDAATIIKNTIAENMPQKAVENALKQHVFLENIYLVAIGKAAWSMAEAAAAFLGKRLIKGIVVTKYGHSKGALENVDVYEAGHPVSDENTIAATGKCISLARGLTEKDELLFLVSGGGSALFEMPLDGITLDDIQSVSNQLLGSGADIIEMNMVRKRLSKVKAGRFAELAAPGRIFSIMLSDVLGDRLDSIASGPAVPDTSTSKDARKVVEKYGLVLPKHIEKCLNEETPKEITNVKSVVTGSVKTLCETAAKTAKELGYRPYVLTTGMNCEAREAGMFFASIARDIQSGVSSFKKPCAIIAGGETVVTLRRPPKTTFETKQATEEFTSAVACEIENEGFWKLPLKASKQPHVVPNRSAHAEDSVIGKGGRNQELALSAARGIEGLADTLIFSLGSDGTDGPTDAAGGIVDGNTALLLRKKGIVPCEFLSRNDSYSALKAACGLIVTGPTGTNVNDVTVLLCR